MVETGLDLLLTVDIEQFNLPRRSSFGSSRGLRDELNVVLLACNLVPRSPTVRRRGDLVKFDLRPGIRACPSSFVHRAARNCDHSW